MVSLRSPFREILPQLSICLLGFLSAVQGQHSQPSNNSDVPCGGRPYILQTTQLPLPSSFNLCPLYPEFMHYNITGRLLNVGPDNANHLGSSDIAFISCDDSSYHGPMKVDDTLRVLITNVPTVAAVLLYSTESLHCNYTVPPNMPRFSDIFTILSPDKALKIRAGLNSSGVGASSIFPDMNQNGGPGGNRNSSSDPASISGSSPTTAVAMVILYSITGIITALFLGIIIAGAIRAHRHPERYGPRTAGRPRQSRARGIARAMLETLPIVKFGGEEDGQQQAAKPDIEMASSNHRNESAGNNRQLGEDEDTRREGRSLEGISQSPAPADNHVKDHDHEHQRDSPPVSGESAGHTSGEDGGRIGPASVPETRAPTPSPSNRLPALVCPICTDEFIIGQDLRLLPCNHKFHPECVDPWLVNVSGTCPLCRIDLNPTSSEEGSHVSRDGHNNLPPPLPEGPDTSHVTASRHHRSRSTHIPTNVNPLPTRDSTVEERLDTLRRLRNENATSAAETSDDHTRTSRLTARLRDRFRIRTRRHGVDPAPASASNP